MLTLVAAVLVYDLARENWDPRSAGSLSLYVILDMKFDKDMMGSWVDAGKMLRGDGGDGLQ
jgi:hypothetical protein